MKTRDKLRSIRDQRQATKRSAFLSVLLAFCVLLACYFFVNSSFFVVGQVVVQGTEGLTESDIFDIARIPPRVNIFRLNLDELRDRLKQDLRIGEVTITRKFPATIIIDIKEAKTVATMANSYGFVQLNDQGVILAAMKNFRQYSVPMITGEKLGTVFVGDQVERTDVLALLKYLNLLDSFAFQQLSEIKIHGNEATALTRTGAKIELGTFDNVEEKARFTQEILHTVGENQRTIQYIDLHFQTPYIKFKS